MNCLAIVNYTYRKSIFVLQPVIASIATGYPAQLLNTNQHVYRPSERDRILFIRLMRAFEHRKRETLMSSAYIHSFIYAWGGYIGTLSFIIPTPRFLYSPCNIWKCYRRNPHNELPRHRSLKLFKSWRRVHFYVSWPIARSDALLHMYDVESSVNWMRSCKPLIVNVHYAMGRLSLFRFYGFVLAICCWYIKLLCRWCDFELEN